MLMKFMTSDEICSIGILVRSSEFETYTKRQMVEFAKELFDIDIPKYLPKTEVLNKIVRKYSIQSAYALLFGDLREKWIIKIRLLSNDNDELERLLIKYPLEV